MAKADTYQDINPSAAKAEPRTQEKDPIMSVETVDTLVVGAGQAGVAVSEHLSRNGVPHLVLERNRIAERWRTERWEFAGGNGPAWHDRFPGWSSPAIPMLSSARKAWPTICGLCRKVQGTDPLRG